MRRYPITWSIIIFTVIMLIVIWRIYSATELGRLNEVAHVRQAPSELYARLLIRYDKTPIYEEEYRLQDIEGVSTFDYRVRGYNGKQITITAPAKRVYDVSYFFGALDNDGVWQIVNRPPRGNTSAHYTIYVKQLADFKHGERTVTFTDPRYWATVAGRQFHLDLSKQKPSDLLQLQSTQLADPRYEQIVEAFRSFGPDEFRRRIAAALASVRKGTP